MKKKQILASMIISTVFLQVANSTIVKAMPTNISENNFSLINVSTIEQLNTKIAYSLTSLNDLEKQYTKLQTEINTTNKKLIIIEKQYKEKEKKFKKLCRNAYMNNDNVDMLNLLFTSKNLSELLERQEFLSIILSNKRKTVVNFKTTKLKLENLVAELNIKKELSKKNQQKQKQKIKDLEKKKIELERLIDEKYDLNTIIKQQSSALLTNIVFSRGGSDIRNNIINFASSFLGMPYKWSGDNPNTSFDCSGLVQYSYSKFGINLPRVSQDQQNIGIDVSLSQAKPGDLVFFGRPAHHIGIYVGDGYMLHAPHTGDYIKVSPIGNVTNIKKVIPD